MSSCSADIYIYNIYIYIYILYIPCSFVDRELEYEGSGNWNKNLTIDTVPEEELGKPGDTVSPHSVGHWAIFQAYTPCG